MGLFDGIEVSCEKLQRATKIFMKMAYPPKAFKGIETGGISENAQAAPRAFM